MWLHYSQIIQHYRLMLCLRQNTHSTFTWAQLKQYLWVRTWCPALKISVLSSVARQREQWNRTTTKRKNPTVNREWTVLTKQEKPNESGEGKKGSGLAGLHVGEETDVGEPWTLPFLWLCVSRLPQAGEWVCVCRVWQRETRSPTSVEGICQREHHSQAYYNTLCVVWTDRSREGKTKGCIVMTK